MAGPAAGVLLSRQLLPHEEALVYEMLYKADAPFKGGSFEVRTTVPIGGSYTGDARPFVITIERFTYETGTLDFSAADIRELECAFNCELHRNITLGAMCNSITDHRILAELLIALAEAFDGIIHFGGCGHHYTGRDPSLTIVELDGGSGMMLDHHICTPDFMRWWLRHPQFRMDY